MSRGAAPAWVWNQEASQSQAVLGVTVREVQGEACASLGCLEPASMRLESQRPHIKEMSPCPVRTLGRVYSEGLQRCLFPDRHGAEEGACCSWAPESQSWAACWKTPEGELSSVEASALSPSSSFLSRLSNIGDDIHFSLCQKCLFMGDSFNQD